MMQKYDFKDPLIYEIPIKKFLEKAHYFVGLEEKDFWTENTIPKKNQKYYKITPNLFICLIFESIKTPYMSVEKEKLSNILIAYRDGNSEYQFFDEKIKTLNNIIDNRGLLDKKIKDLNKARDNLPKFEQPSTKELEIKPYESFLLYTGYETSIETLKGKYIVFDVETNGTRTADDDLLSISIYDPTTGFCYNRFLPLDLQPVILTSYINGITEHDIKDCSHITQEEMDWIYDIFDLKNKILLSYSGGKGTFDSLFIKNYCKRHKIKGFNDLIFQNIKSLIPKAPLGHFGSLSKDNLCKIFGIEGVNDIHTSYNDCILQWKLFEKLYDQKLILIDRSLYFGNKEYIIPTPYLYNFPKLAECLGVCASEIKMKSNKIFEYCFPIDILNQIKNFPTNMIGKTIEYGLKSYLNAVEQDNREFFLNNRLQYISSLDGLKTNKIRLPKIEDASLILRPEDEEYIKKSPVAKLIIESIKELIVFIKQNIFLEDKVMFKEISINNDKTIFALCNLSDKKNILTIKTKNIFENRKEISNNDANQLFFQANGRNIYVICIDCKVFFNRILKESCYEKINITIYKAELIDDNK